MSSQFCSEWRANIVDAQSRLSAGDTKPVADPTKHKIVATHAFPHDEISGRRYLLHKAV